MAVTEPRARRATTGYTGPDAVGVLVPAAAIGLLYLGPAYALAAVLVAIIVVVAAWRPVGPLLAIPAALSLIDRPVGIGTLEFNPAEILLVATVAGVGLRGVWALGRARSVAIRSFVTDAWPMARGGFGAVSIAWLVLGTLSLLTVADPAHRHESIRAYRWVILEPVVYAFLVRWYLRRGRDRHLAGALYVGAAALASLYGLVSLLAGSGLAVEGVVRVSGTYPHPNALALYLERPVVFAAAMGLAFTPRLRLRWLVAAGICGVALLLTFSRGALIGAGLATLAVVWLGQRRRVTLLVAGAGAALVAALAVTAGPRLLSLFSGGSGSLRLDIWQSSLAMLRDHPVFGVGLDQFLYQYAPRYVHPQAWSERFTSHPHNLVLDVWLSLGIMGLIAAAAYAVTFVRRVRRVVALRSLIGLGAVGAIIAGALHGMVDNGYFLPGLALAFWFLTALIDLETSGAGVAGDGRDGS